MWDKICYQPKIGYPRLAQIAYELACAEIPAYRHPNSRHDYTQPQLVACVLFGAYLELSFRDLEAWLRINPQCRQLLNLSQTPSYSALCRAAQHLRLTRAQALYQQLRQRALDAEEADQQAERAEHLQALLLGRRA